MSAESNEQYRAGFEAWAIGPTGPYGGEVWLRKKGGHYAEDCVEARWQGWLAAKREASTEPSAKPLAYALVRNGKVEGVQRTIEAAQAWVNAEIVPLYRAAGALTDSLADQLAQARYADYVQECDRRGLRPSSFYGFKVVCAEVEHAICVQVLIRCRHPASSSADDAKDVARLDFIVQEECQVWEVNGRYSVRAVTEAHPITGEHCTARAAIDAAMLAHTKAGSGK